MIAIPIPREGDGGFPWDSRQTDELAKQLYVKMRKDDEAEVKAFVKFNQEYAKLRKIDGKTFSAYLRATTVSHVFSRK